MTDAVKSKKKVLIVDDEPAARTAMRLVIERFDELTIAAEIGDGRSAIEAIEKLHPDIVFLDIEMPEMDGFSVAKATKNINYQLIFVTAFDQYALDAFDTHAIDYLLKPVRPQLLEKCLRKIIHHEEIVLEALAKQKSASNSIVLSDGKASRIIQYQDIVYIEGLGRYRRLHLTEKGKLVHNTQTILSDTTLDDFEGQLVLNNFMRNHRSYLINLHYVIRVYSESRRYFVTLLNKQEAIPVSRSQVAALKQLL